MSEHNPSIPARAALLPHFFAVQDLTYGDFHSSLVPNFSRERIIGVRMPQLRAIAKALAAGKLTDSSHSVKTSPLRWQDYFAEIEDTYVRWQEQCRYDAPETCSDASEDCCTMQKVCSTTQNSCRPASEDCSDAPLYYEEILTAGLALSYAKLSLEERFDWIRRFVPMIDNWAVCDTFCSTWKPKEADLAPLWDFLTTDYLAILRGSIEEGGRPVGAAEYDLRYGVVMLLNHFVQRGDYVDRVLSICNEINHPAYYVKMAVAWALSYGFIFFPEKTIALFQSPDNHLDDFTYNKSIQKACESFRVPKETKNFLRSLRR